MAPRRNQRNAPNASERAKRVRSNLEVISIICGILGFIIVLWQVFGPMFSSNSKTKAENMKPLLDATIHCQYDESLVDDNNNIGTSTSFTSIGAEGKLLFSTDTLHNVRYPIKMKVGETDPFTHPGTPSTFFKPGDKVKIYVMRPESADFEKFSYDIVFSDMDGNKYYQRVKPAKDTHKDGCPFAIDLSEVTPFED